MPTLGSVDDYRPFMGRSFPPKDDRYVRPGLMAIRRKSCGYVEGEQGMMQGKQYGALGLYRTIVCTLQTAQ